MITDNVELDVGEYKYKITKDSGNIFMPMTELISEGNFFVGDKNELRFLDKIIRMIIKTDYEINLSLS